MGMLGIASGKAIMISSQCWDHQVGAAGLGDETIFDLESVGRFMLLDAAAGHVTVQKIQIIRGNCAALVGEEFGAGFALSLVASHWGIGYGNLNRLPPST